MGRMLFLSEPACPFSCERCSLHCAGVVMILADLRRDQERLLREMSRHPQAALREELRLVEEHLGTAALAFERSRPCKDQRPQNREAWRTLSSAQLH